MALCCLAMGMAGYGHGPMAHGHADDEDDEADDDDDDDHLAGPCGRPYGLAIWPAIWPDDDDD